MKLRTIKRGMLGFWGIWTAIVFASNAVDGLKALGVAPGSWAFSSGNYAYMEKVTGVYATPGWLVGLLFAGVVFWEGLSAGLFGYAAIRYDGRSGRGMGWVHLAFACGLTLWCGFMLADEIFVSYAVEDTHRGLFVAQLVCLLAIHLLPDD